MIKGKARKKSVVLWGLLAIGVAFALGRFGGGAGVSVRKETAFERVMRTNTLRCGYYAHAPVTIKDLVSGKMSGLAVDVMEAIASKTGVKVEWTEEVTFGNWVPALQAGRFDAVCTPLWADASYSRVALFSRALFYAEISARRQQYEHYRDQLMTFKEAA